MVRALLLAGGVIHASIVAAQAPSSTLVGRVVRAGTLTPIPGADVRLAPGPQRGVTDALGAFRFDRVTPGRYFVIVRRLGFVPDSLPFDVPLASGASVILPLREAPQTLDTVSVTGRDELLARGKLAGFYERRKFGMGRFLEEKDIEKFLTRRLADIIVARMPGTRSLRSAKGGMAAYIATTRIGAGATDQRDEGCDAPAPMLSRRLSRWHHSLLVRLGAKSPGTTSGRSALRRELNRPRASFRD